MTIKPLHDWAVIRPSAEEDLTEGGLYIPDTAKEKPHEGIVEAIGPGAYEEEQRHKKRNEKERRFIPTVVKPGDLVLYEPYGGRSYTIEGHEFVLVREKNILGTLEGKQARPKTAPLQIPSVTTASSTTMLAERSRTFLKTSSSAQAVSRKKTAKKKVKSLNKKAASKTTKKEAAAKPSKKNLKKKIVKSGKPKAKKTAQKKTSRKK
ncbi:MAG: co-chaperone GroES [Nitrospirota bacterium]